MVGGRRARSTLLRARGGISQPQYLALFNIDSSPRTRRYFHRHCPASDAAELFSAHAEVFPRYAPPYPRWTALLRARGGIS